MNNSFSIPVFNLKIVYLCYNIVEYKINTMFYKDKK